MAITKTVSTNYSNTAKRDMDDVMSLLYFKKTPVFSSLAKGSKAIELYVEKPEDILSKAGDNAAIEGADAVVADRVAPTIVSNRVQRLNKVYGVSGDMEEQAQYGRKSELSRQRGLNSKELVQDTEWALTNGTLQVGDGSSNASKMNGLVKLAPAANTYDFSSTAANTNHITEDIILDTMEKLWEAGADPDTIIAPPKQKRKISNFSDKGRLTVNVDASKKKLDMVVNILATDFGTVVVLPSPFVEPSSESGPVYYDKVLIYEKGKMKKKMFRSFKDEKLAKTGDSMKYEMQHSLTVLPDSLKALGLIENLTRVPVPAS